MFLLQFELLLAVVLYLSHHACAAGIDIDLNQPAYPGEEFPTLNMMPVSTLVRIL